MRAFMFYSLHVQNKHFSSIPVLCSGTLNITYAISSSCRQTFNASIDNNILDRRQLNDHSRWVKLDGLRNILLLKPITHKRTCASVSEFCTVHRSDKRVVFGTKACHAGFNVSYRKVETTSSGQFS